MVWATVIAAGRVLLAVLHGPSLFADSSRYLDTGDRLSVFQVIPGRGPGVLLQSIYLLPPRLGVAIVATLIAVAWALVALAAARLALPRYATAAFIGVELWSLAPWIQMWDTAVMTEGLVIAGSALLVAACFLPWARGLSTRALRWTAAGGLVGFGIAILTRPSAIVYVFPLLILGAVLGRRSWASALQPAGRIVAAILVGLFVTFGIVQSVQLARVNDGWYAQNRLAARADARYLELARQAGMPDCPELETAVLAAPNQFELVRASDCAQLQSWFQSGGLTPQAEVLGDPARVVNRAVADAQRTLTPPEKAQAWSLWQGRGPGPWAFWTTILAMAGFVLTAVVARVRGSSGTNAPALMWVGGVLVSLLSVFLAWLQDGMEPARHALPASVLLAPMSLLAVCATATQARDKAAPSTPDRRPSPPGVGRGLAGLVAAVSLVVSAICVSALALLPVNGTQTTATWQPDGRRAMTIPLALMTGPPERASIATTCSAVGLASLSPAFTPVGTLRGEPGLGLAVSGGYAYPVIAGQPAAASRVRLPAAPCDVVLTYDGATDAVTLSVGPAPDQQAQVKGLSHRNGTAQSTPVSISGLEWDAKVQEPPTMTVVSHPSTIAWPAWRWALVGGGCLALVFLVAMGRRSWNGSRRGSGALPPQGFATLPTPGWTASDTAVAASAVVAAFVIPALPDDGWVKTTIRAYTDLGYFSNYFTASAAPQPQGFWWTFIERAWVAPLDQPLLLLRVPALILAVLTWWYVRRRLLDQMTPDPATRRIVRVGSSSIAVLFVLAWMATLRPEPLVALLLACQIGLVLTFWRTRSAAVLPALGAVAALALAAHQSGWIVVTASAAALPVLVGKMTASGAERRRLVLIAVGSLLASVLACASLLLLHSNGRVLRWAQAAFASGDAHSATLAEIRRLSGLAEGAVPIRIACLGLIIATALAFLARRPRGLSPGPVTVIGWASLCALAGLLLTASKWQWHLSATMPAVLALAGAALVTTRSHVGMPNARAAAWLMGSALLVALSLRSSGAWSRFDVLDSAWDGDPLASLPAALAWGLVSAAAALGATWLIRRRAANATADGTLAPDEPGERPSPSQAVEGQGRSWNPLIPASIVSACAVLAVVTLWPLLNDHGSSAAWPRLVATSMEPGACGLAGPEGFAVPTVTANLPISGVQPVFPNASVQQSTSRLASFRPVESPLWQAETGAGVIRTPAFLLDPDRPAQTWAAVNGPAQITVVWLDGSGTEIARNEVGREAAAEYWALIDLRPPADAAMVAFEWLAGGGVAGVLNPVAVVKTAPFTALVGSDAVWTGPGTSMWAPCLPAPSIATGFLEDFRWAFGDTQPLVQPNMAGERAFAELACVEDSSGSRLCAYSVASQPPFGLTLTQTPAQW